MNRSEMQAANKPDFERQSGLPIGYFDNRKYPLLWPLLALVVGVLLGAVILIVG